MPEERLVAVLDVGKTNLKLLLLDRRGRIRAEAARRNASLPGPPYPHLDSEGVWRWLLQQLSAFAARWPVGCIVATTHGGAAALVGDDGLELPILDYEFEPPDGAEAYRSIAPPFTESFAPLLPAGLNLARQIFWQQSALPDAFRRVRHILCYPQYLAWRLSGVAASEVTSLGAHTHLWAPRRGDFTSLVDELGWRPLFPPIRPAWERLGPIRPEIAAQTGLDPACEVLCGIHDSNAALLLYLRSQAAGFALASTGTWLILLRPGHAIDALDAARDTLANVDVTGRPVATARFMGGREYELLAGDAAGAPVDVANVQRLIERGTFALPSFAPAGPFPDRAGRIAGPEPENRAGLAMLYVALMTDAAFDLIGAEDDLLVDGGFASNPLYCGLLAALRPKQAVRRNGAKEGTATGASLLARWHDPEIAVPLDLDPVQPLAIEGLAAYARAWRRQAEHP